MAPGSQYPSRSATNPFSHALQIFTEASRECWGTHLGELPARGTWSQPESKLQINCLELKAVLLALKVFQVPLSDKVVLIATDNITVGAKHKQRRRHEVGPTVCPTVENPELVVQEMGNSQGLTHSRPVECSSTEKAIQARPDHSDRMLSPSRSLPCDMR